MDDYTPQIRFNDSLLRRIIVNSEQIQYLKAFWNDQSLTHVLWDSQLYENIIVGN